MTIHFTTAKRLGIGLATSGVLLASMVTITRGDDPPPSRLGRLLRLGGTRPADAPAVGKPSDDTALGTTARRPASDAPPPYPTPTAAGSRLVPQPRTSHAVTESDPLVTRVSIGRTEDGKQFSMFMEVFADGTVLDSDGVHRVGAEQLRPIAVMLQAGDLANLKGHCGGPATDYIEQVHFITYDRYRGRLRATPFSFSGNPQGCDPAVKKLNDAIDAIQTKLAGPPVIRPAGAAPIAASASPAPVPTPPADAPPRLSSSSIRLTPDGRP